MSKDKPKEIIKKEEVVHKIQFKTIEAKKKPPKKTKAKRKPRPKKTKAQLLLEKKQKQKRIKKRKEKLKKLKQKRLEQKIKREKLRKLKKQKRLEKLEKQRLEKEKKEKLKKEKEDQAKEQSRLDGIKTGFVNGVRSKMQEFQRYPLISKARREEGTVYLSFQVHKDGTITNIKINKSSGYKRLDKAALKIFRRMGTDFKIPADLKEEYMNLVLPVIFKLK